MQTLSTCRPAEALCWARDVLRDSPENRKARLRAGRAALLLGALGDSEAHYEALLVGLRSSEPAREPRYAPPPPAAAAAAAAATPSRRIGAAAGLSAGLGGAAALDAAAAAVRVEAREGLAAARRLQENAQRSTRLAAAGCAAPDTQHVHTCTCMHIHTYTHTCMHVHAQ